MQVYDNKKSRPIAFASRSLFKVENNYSQLNKEVLALVFGVIAFHQYIFGRKFIFEMDHKPLIFIFGEKNGLPIMSRSRVYR